MCVFVIIRIQLSNMVNRQERGTISINGIKSIVGAMSNLYSQELKKGVKYAVKKV